MEMGEGIAFYLVAWAYRYLIPLNRLSRSPSPKQTLISPLFHGGAGGGLNVPQSKFASAIVFAAVRIRARVLRDRPDPPGLAPSRPLPARRRSGRRECCRKSH